VVGCQHGVEHLPLEERLRGLRFPAQSGDGFRGGRQQPVNTKEDDIKQMKLGSLLTCTARGCETISIKRNKEALT